MESAPGGDLRVEGLHVAYGNVPALRGIDLHVGAGERVALIGANGAGKTTLLRTISGLVRPSAGTITYGADDLGRIAAHRVVGLGIVHVPEGRQVFARQTVRDNLLLGGRAHGDRNKAGERLDFVLETLPQLRVRLKARASDLSGGQQQMLAIGRALMGAPKLLMIDELSLGLAPIAADEIAETVAGLTRDHDMSLLIVEQNVAIALALSDRTYILRTGSIAGDHKSSDLVGDRDVVLQYLGA